VTKLPSARGARSQAGSEAGGVVTRASLGAWLIKCNPSVTDADAILQARTITSWCVAGNYRAELMAAGDPVVFWISGSGRRTPVAGVWGHGHLTGPVADGARPSVPMVVRLLADPVPRVELRAMPEFASLEVLRQPMASNPSWLDQAQWRALRSLLSDTGNEAAPPTTVSSFTTIRRRRPADGS
jgi:hypothetical protein